MLVSLGQLLTGIGIVVCVIASVVLAIKFITADPEKKAALQKQLIGLIISMVVIIGAFTIWSVTINILGGATNAPSAQP